MGSLETSARDIWLEQWVELHGRELKKEGEEEIVTSKEEEERQLWACPGSSCFLAVIV